MRLEIPRLQKSLNILLRQHWAARAKEQAIFDLLVLKAVREQGKGQHFRGKKVTLDYTLYFKDGVKHDYSNYGQKMIDDSLVKARVIDDDSCLVVVEETLKIKKDKNNPRTEVVISEVIF